MVNVVPFVREGLGNNSYLIQLGEGEAALIDPDRSIGRYLEAAGSRGWSIVAVFETHLHADFISGAREAAHATGAQIYLPDGSEARFPHTPLNPGQRVQLQRAVIEPIASPGHTPEHLSYLVSGERGEPALFSGGSLIVGGAARTDLISPQLTEPLTRAQYRTLRFAFSSLSDETFLFPTHGAGSFCSLGATDRRVSTLGEEGTHNPLLFLEDEEEFVQWFPSTFPAAPSYFYRTRPINQAGPRLHREIAMPAPLSPEEFDLMRQRALVIDVRSMAEYTETHISGSLSNTFRGVYATWLGWLVPRETPLLFVTGDVPVEQVVDESLLVGHESFAGWLAGGMEAWVASGRPVQQARLVDALQARKALLEGAISLDVREQREFDSGHIEDAIHIPLGTLEQRLGDLPQDRPILVYCGHGERSATGLSILERAGLGPLLNLDGGFGAWREAGYRVA
jgi:hydroxyacylglutathione hydrolase